MQTFNGLTMWMLSTLRLNLDVETSSSKDKEKSEISPENKYKKVLDELNELEDEGKDNDKVELVNKDLNNIFRDYLINNPAQLEWLKTKVEWLKNKAEAWWEGFKKLVKFLEKFDKEQQKPRKEKREDNNSDKNKKQDKLETKMESDYNEFMNKLDDPKKLSNMNKNKIDRVKTYIENNKSEAKALYTKMKGVNLEIDKKINQKDKDVFNEVLVVIKNKYNNDPDFLKEDFKDLDDSVSNLKKYAGNDWKGENLSNDAILQNFDPSKTIISKEFFINTFNTYNEQRIDGIKDATIKWCYEALVSKYDFQKTNNNELQFKLKDSDTRFFVGNETIQKDFNGVLTALILNQNNLVDNEAEKLLNSWSSDILQALLNDGRIIQPQEIVTNNSQRQSSSPETTTISEKERAMTETDFNAMKEYLNDNMFIESNDGNYSYDLNKLKSYLQSYRENPDDFRLHTTKSEIAKRRVWISAIQILLNAKYPNNKIAVDWKFWEKGGGIYSWETYDAVKNFQREYNKSHSDATIAEDWVPGPITIAALLEE